LPLVTLDRSQIQSVIINIIINALDATEAGRPHRIFTAASLSGNGAAQEASRSRLPTRLRHHAREPQQAL